MRAVAGTMDDAVAGPTLVLLLGSRVVLWRKYGSWSISVVETGRWGLTAAGALVEENSWRIAGDIGVQRTKSMPWRSRKKDGVQGCLESPCVARPASCLYLAADEHFQILREDATLADTIRFHMRQFGRFWWLTWKLATTPKEKLIQRALYQETLRKNVHASAGGSSCQWPSVSTSADGSPTIGWSQGALPAEDCYTAVGAILLVGLIAFVFGRRRRRRRNARLLLNTKAVRAEGAAHERIAARLQARRSPLYVRAMAPFDGTSIAPLVPRCAVVGVMGVVVHQANIFLGVVHASGQRLIFVQEVFVHVQAGISIDWWQVRAAAMRDATSTGGDSEGSSVRRAPVSSSNQPAVTPFAWRSGHGRAHGGSDGESDRGRVHPVGSSAEELGDEYVIGLLVWNPETPLFHSTVGMLADNDVDVGHGDMHATVQGEYAPEDPRAAVMQAAQPEIHDREFAAAVSIQTCWRAFAAVKEANAVRNAAAQDEMKCCTAAILVQTRWRGHSARVLAKRKRAAAAHWQHFARRIGFTVRCRRSVSASLIQALWRGRSARAIAVRRTKALLILQSFSRRASAARQARTHRRSVVRAHAHWHDAARRVRMRAAVAVAKALAVAAKKRRAAVSIQAVARGQRERRRQVVQRGVVVLQSVVRGMCARRTRAVQTRKASATLTDPAPGMHVATGTVCQEGGPQADGDRRRDTASDLVQDKPRRRRPSKSDVLAAVRHEKWVKRKAAREQKNLERKGKTGEKQDPAHKASLVCSNQADPSVIAGTVEALAAGAGREASAAVDSNGSSNGVRVGVGTMAAQTSKGIVVVDGQQEFARLLSILGSRSGVADGGAGEGLLQTSSGASGGAGLPRLAPKGLVNTGHFCFRGVILQVLLACKPFMRVMAEASEGLLTSVPQRNTLPAWKQLAQLLAQFEQGAKVGAATRPTSQALRQANAGSDSAGKGRLRGGKSGKGIGTGGYPAIGRGGGGLGSKTNGTARTNSVTAETAFNRSVGGMKRHEDAHQFFAFLVNQLHEQIVRASCHDQQQQLQHGEEIAEDGREDKKENNFGKKRGDEQRGAEETMGRNGGSKTPERMLDNVSTVVTELFQGTYQSEVRQRGISESSITFDPFKSLELPLQPKEKDGVVRVEDALAEFFAEETIEDYKGFNSEGAVVKKQTLDNVPQVLTLHLKQFRYSAMCQMTFKLKRKVSYPACLSIPETAMSPALRRRVTKAGERLKYRLFAVVLHNGDSASCGHYTAMTRGLDGRQWRWFDDQKVTVKQESEVLRPPECEHPYLLFYERV